MVDEGVWNGGGCVGEALTLSDGYESVVGLWRITWILTIKAGQVQHPACSRMCACGRGWWALESEESAV
jgi:hypothetical protein